MILMSPVYAPNLIIVRTYIRMTWAFLRKPAWDAALGVPWPGRDAGKGLDGVVLKGEGYFNPFIEVMLGKR